MSDPDDLLDRAGAAFRLYALLGDTEAEWAERLDTDPALRPSTHVDGQPRWTVGAIDRYIDADPRSEPVGAMDLTDERGQLLPNWHLLVTPAHLRPDVPDFDLDGQLDGATT